MGRHVPSGKNETARERDRADLELSALGGFLGVDYLSLMWVIIVGSAIILVASKAIASDVEMGTMEVTLTDSDGAAFDLTSAVVSLAVKTNETDTTVLIEKTSADVSEIQILAPASGGVLEIYLLPADTASLFGSDIVGSSEGFALFALGSLNIRSLSCKPHISELDDTFAILNDIGWFYITVNNSSFMSIAECLANSLYEW